MIVECIAARDEKFAARLVPPENRRAAGIRITGFFTTFGIRWPSERALRRMVCKGGFSYAGGRQTCLPLGGVQQFQRPYLTSEPATREELNS
jgi:hypothetical protein